MDATVCCQPHARGPHDLFELPESYLLTYCRSLRFQCLQWCVQKTPRPSLHMFFRFACQPVAKKCGNHSIPCAASRTGLPLGKAWQMLAAACVDQEHLPPTPHEQPIRSELAQQCPATPKSRLSRISSFTTALTYRSCKSVEGFAKLQKWRGTATNPKPMRTVRTNRPLAFDAAMHQL